MKPYPDYKDSGIKWIGEIPEHWEMVKLKNIASIKYGLSQPPKEKDGGLPLIRATNINQGKIINKDLIYVDPDDIPYDREPILEQNDVLVVRSGAYTGDSAIVTKEYEGAVAGYDLVVRVNKANPHFIAYGLISPYILNHQIDLCRSRAAQPHLNAVELGNVIFLVPPELEQEQTIITRFLGHKTKQIDSLIEKKQRQIELLKEYRTALINQAVTKGLNPDVKMKDSGIEWLGEIPEHWEVAQLGRLIKLQRGIDINKNMQIDGKIPVISSGGISSYHNVSVAKGPGVIVGRKGSLGTVYYIESDYWPHDTTLWVKEFRNNYPKYIYYLLLVMKLENYDTGSSNPTLNRNIVHPEYVPMITFNEQNEITKFLDQKIAALDLVVNFIEKKIIKFQEYRTALISNVVTGKIDVRDEVIP